MPLYEYVCTGCGYPQERVVPHTEADQPGPCPQCDQRLKRRFSRVGVRLDGWGFARTDGMVPPRPDRPDYRTIRERAERISDGGGA